MVSISGKDLEMEPRKDHRLFPYLKEAWIALAVSSLITWLLRDTDNMFFGIFLIITGILFFGLTMGVPQIWFISKTSDGILRHGKKETLSNKLYDFLGGFYWLIYLVIITLLIELL